MTELTADRIRPWAQPESSDQSNPNARQKQQSRNHAAAAASQCQHQQRSGERDDRECLTQSAGALTSGELDARSLAGATPPRLCARHQCQRPTSQEAAEGQSTGFHPDLSRAAMSEA
jgi:hypothetical protein